MRLIYTRTSPFARKVLVCAHELGLADALELEEDHPLQAGSRVPLHNPLGKVPALETDDVQLDTLIDSPLICEYLHTLVEGSTLFPSPDSPERWRVGYLHALGDGVMDAAVLLRLQNQRALVHRSEQWTNRWHAAIDRSVATFEMHVATLGAPEGPCTIADVSAACALGYLDFRHPDYVWRAAAPALAAWFEGWSQRDAFVQTAPPPD